MTSEYKDFINAMPDEWQLDEETEEQVQIEITEHKNIKRYIEDKLNDLEEVSPRTKEQ